MSAIRATALAGNVVQARERRLAAIADARAFGDVRTLARIMPRPPPTSTRWRSSPPGAPARRAARRGGPLRALRAIALGDRGLAGEAYAELLPYAGHFTGGATAAATFGPIARVLTELALFLGRPVEVAAGHYREAAEAAARLGAPHWSEDAASALARLGVPAA